MDAWWTIQYRLKIGLGVSGALLAAGILAPVVDRATNTHISVDGYRPAVLVSWFLIPAALVSTIVFAARLGIHTKRRPILGTARIQFDGLSWRF